MKRIKLDKIDRKILQKLQDEGRITNVELAKEAGISAPPCLRRMRALEEAGYIKGYHARVDPSVLGYSVTVYAQVKLTSQSEKDMNEFDDWVRSLPKIREAHMLTGDVDYLLKVVAKDWDDYQHFINKEITQIANVESVKSALTVKSVKEDAGVPIDV